MQYVLQRRFGSSIGFEMESAGVGKGSIMWGELRFLGLWPGERSHSG